MTKRLMFVLAIFFGIGLISCENYVIEYGEIDRTIPIDFTAEILPMFSGCTSTICHGGSVSPNLSAGNAYTNLMEGGYVDKQNPESSKLYKKLQPGGSHNDRVSTPDLEKILIWIEQGAKD